MALYASWVHGHSAQIELNERGRGASEDVGGVPWTSIIGSRRGGQVTFRGQDNSAYWFHLAVPTPVIENGVRARLIRAMFLFTADPAVTLGSVHVWDGPSRVFARDGLAIGGTQLALQENLTQFTLPSSEVRWGIGISLLFNFADAGNVGLHTAGVDFDI